jgi:glycosyltransferase involved in cell wall biosynthesis
LAVSLSLILPVHNGDRHLATRVSELLDLLTDHPDRFEILIVDDGSDDQTIDVASGLARAYPQVRLLRLGARGGWPLAARLAMDRSAGDVVLVCNPACRISAGEFAALWSLRHDQDVVFARSQPQGAADELLEMLADPANSDPAALPPMPPGVLFMRPSLWRELIPSPAARRNVTIDRITRTDLCQRRASRPALVERRAFRP